MINCSTASKVIYSVFQENCQYKEHTVKKVNFFNAVRTLGSVYMTVCKIQHHTVIWEKEFYLPILVRKEKKVLYNVLESWYIQYHKVCHNTPYFLTPLIMMAPAPVKRITKRPFCLPVAPPLLKPRSPSFWGAAGLRLVLMERCALYAILAGRFFTCVRGEGGVASF